MSVSFLRTAVVYFVLAVALGIYMGATQHLAQIPVHAHLNLLGWVSMAVFGLIYHAHPPAATTALARWHFWIYQLGVPVLMVAVWVVHAGNAAAEPVAGVASVILGIGIVLFAVNVWRTIPAAA
jgi:cbb3-type cytochrome oxidase subunit 1